MTQEQAILEYLLKGYTLDPLTALQKFGCFRLAARIHQLRTAVQIESIPRVSPEGKRWVGYRLAP